MLGTTAPHLIDLPPFDPAPPTKINWSYNPKESHNETNRIIRFMKQRMKDTNICSDDIIRTFISRRVLPLKRRAHKMPRTVCIESDKRGRCRKRGLDKFDPDPVIFWRDLKMGRTPAARLGKSPPEPAGSSDELTILEVHEHVAPLQAEAGQEFVDKLMAQGQKNKTPASDAGQANLLLPSARTNPSRVSPALKLGSRPEGSAGSARTSTSLLIPARHHLVPQHLCLPSGGTTSRGARPLHRQISTRRRTLPHLQRPKTPAPATWAPERTRGRAEPLVPPVPEKKKRKKTSSKAAPETSVPATSTPTPPPETSVPATSTPTPPPTQGPPATAPKPPPASLKITDFLKPGASRGKAADGSASSGSQPLVLHVGPAAAVVQHKPSGLLGRIVELKREGKDLGHLLPYAQKWNDADISAATRGLGKDRLPAPDPAGPRSTEEHFTRLKHAVKEFDSAWYDATSNVVSTADARKALFEELLWEHRDLAEAHNKCQAFPEASLEALKAQVAALQAEKEQLIRDHQKALEAQKEISRELKDQAIQAGVRHAEELKAAEAAAEARLNEALEDAGNANVVLQAELEEGAKALKVAEGKAAKAHKAAAEEATRAQKAAEGGSRG
ncbi:hypothetical protein QYE76_012027 [Lolium multiflorum]|uniref:Uncharacterized protein n=1 Tax=Lolium multiflorum TaxID=4521 RepID=A0AAD8X4J9_LOLMU|nr:hypothetical protein QYE76_012027 [Lolium multiflorum]